MAKKLHPDSAKLAALQIAILLHCSDLMDCADLLISGRKKTAIAKLRNAVSKLERVTGASYRDAKIARRRDELGRG